MNKKEKEIFEIVFEEGIIWKQRVKVLTRVLMLVAVFLIGVGFIGLYLGGSI